MAQGLPQSNVEFEGNDDIQLLLGRVCELTGMGFAAVARVTESRWVALQVEDRVAFGLKPGDELEIKKTICDEIRESGTAVLIDDVGCDPDWWNHPVPVLYGFRSYVSLPIVIDGTFFGTLCALGDTPRQEPLALAMAELENIAAIIAAHLDPPRPSPGD